MSASTPIALQPTRGRIACVGTGITLGSHLTPLARTHIKQADIVFAALSHRLMELWLERINPAFRSLQPYYAEGKSRATTYREWVELMMSEVRLGKRVCGVFYGHPGVFAWSPHRVIQVARAEGYDAHMEPGISAEDCLYADLGIDPGDRGCQHLEASQMLFYERKLDTTGYVVIWQVSAIGDRSLTRFSTSSPYRSLLIELLLNDYAPEHEVILYSAATLPIQGPGIRRLALRDLADEKVTGQETLVIPPGKRLKPDKAMRARLDRLDAIQEDTRPGARSIPG
ncbi:SAM-dependent methyltransferase [Luteibacter sp. 9135]|uniref:SAM-dependent methyltransferase n=1 Tax=Luteibacter sp. 9135 TaxID=1500893 RepID=UPI00068BEFE9|nr:SAM-dependent methyltransferase [Luteibacter sp. 9135]